MDEIFTHADMPRIHDLQDTINQSVSQSMSSNGLHAFLYEI